MLNKQIRKKRIVKSTFLQKLSIILANPNYQQIIRWSENGEFFIILDKLQFETILPENFRHKKLQSFQRQLSFYGFQRICIEKQNTCYHHPFFTKIHQDLQLRKLEIRSESKSDFNTLIQDLKQLQADIKSIKISQTLMKQNISNCLLQLNDLNNKMSLVIQFSFGFKQYIAIEARNTFVPLLRLILGLQFKKQTFFQVLTQLIFPFSEIFQTQSGFSSPCSYCPFVSYTLTTRDKVYLNKNIENQSDLIQDQFIINNLETNIKEQQNDQQQQVEQLWSFIVSVLQTEIR